MSSGAEKHTHTVNSEHLAQVAKKDPKQNVSMFCLHIHDLLPEH